MFDQVYNYENKIFFNDNEFVGLDSADFSYSHSQKTIKALGFSVGQTVVSGPVQQKISLSYPLIQGSPFYSALIQGIPIGSGSINYNGSSYGFKSGYVENYSVNCAVGSIPRESSSISVFNQMERGINASGALPLSTIKGFPSQGTISVTCDNSTTNRVVGFDLSIKASVNPVNSVNFKQATSVAVSPILEYAATIQIDVDDAFLQNSFDFFNELEEKTINLTIQGRQDGTLFNSWDIPKATLVGESLSSSADGGVKLTLNYVGHT